MSDAFNPITADVVEYANGCRIVLLERFSPRVFLAFDLSEGMDGRYSVVEFYRPDDDAFRTLHPVEETSRTRAEAIAAALGCSLPDGARIGLNMA